MKMKQLKGENKVYFLLIIKNKLKNFKLTKYQPKYNLLKSIKLGSSFFKHGGKIGFHGAKTNKIPYFLFNKDF